MVSINAVAVLGGTGNLGTFIVQELVAAGFTVTGVTREASTNSTPKFPEGLDIKKVDYESFDNLKAAFDGQDAVVSVVGTFGIASQKVAIDAAVAAGVKRFIPSEFGVNTRKLGNEPIGKILAGKIAIVDYLQEKASENPGFTWTGLSTGLFFDKYLSTDASGINVKERTATVVDSGNAKWQATQRAHVGKAVAGILQHPDETANKYLESLSFNVSTKEIIDIIEELTGVKFTIHSQSSAELQKAGEEKLAQGDFRAFVDFLRVLNGADGKGTAVEQEQSVNEMIGLPLEDVREVITRWLQTEGII